MVVGMLVFFAGKLTAVVLLGGMWLVDELEQLGEVKGVWDISHDVLVVGVAAHGVGTGIYHAHKHRRLAAKKGNSGTKRTGQRPREHQGRTSGTQDGSNKP